MVMFWMVMLLSIMMSMAALLSEKYPPSMIRLPVLWVYGIGKRGCIRISVLALNKINEQQNK